MWIEMENDRMTELVFVLDRSGSMAGLEDDTIGGFNAMLKKQKKQEGEVIVTTVLFDTFAQTVHDRVPIQKVRPLTHEDYHAGGSTALLDALGDTVRRIEADVSLRADADDDCTIRMINGYAAKGVMRCQTCGASRFFKFCKKEWEKRAQTLSHGWFCLSKRRKICYNIF